MKIREIALAAAIVAATGVAVPGSAAATPPDSAVGYWTADRVHGAQPRDVVLDADRGPAVPRPKPDNPGNKPDKNPNDGTDDGAGDSGGVVTGAPWPEGGPQDPIDDLVGKVLFTLGGNDYVCSASTIAPSSGTGWVVMTAGHCAWDDSTGVASNWVFVPDFETVREWGCSPDDVTLGQSGGGCYAAASLHPHGNWMAPGNDYLADVAFADMADDRPTQTGVGSLPVLRTQTAVDVEVTALGYPAAKKYSGSDLTYCVGVAGPGPGSYSSNPALACDMTGGSSGGPWYSDVDDDGVLEATSLNSFGLRGYNGFMFGPVFDGGAAAALAAASS